ncbi:Serine/threonine-protein kinase [Ceratobasidium sp. AG-Ba]|nr:Serine/threonine-protein kinase [Ceratobasidium sp. AG-Ba]
MPRFTITVVSTTGAQPAHHPSLLGPLLRQPIARLLAQCRSNPYPIVPLCLQSNGQLEFLIGSNRFDRCDLVFNKVRISARHCELIWNNSKGFDLYNNPIKVRDLITYGTYVRGRKIGKGGCCYIRPGDPLSLGDSSEVNGLELDYYTYRLEGPPPPPVQSPNTVVRESSTRTGQGVVCFAIKVATGTRVAIKKSIKAQPDLSEAELDCLKWEAYFLGTAKQRHVIDIHDCFLDEIHPTIVLEAAKTSLQHPCVLHPGYPGLDRGVRLGERIKVSAYTLAEYESSYEVLYVRENRSLDGNIRDASARGKRSQSFVYLNSLLMGMCM